MNSKLEVVKAVIAAWSAGDLEGALAHMDDDEYFTRDGVRVAPPMPGFWNSGAS